MTKGCSLRKAIKLLGGDNIKLHKGYYYCSGFFTTADGQIWYISTSDVRTSYGVKSRFDKKMDIMYRTAKNYSDYTGGDNKWDFVSRLEDLGYYVNSVPYND